MQSRPQSAPVSDSRQAPLLLALEPDRRAKVEGIRRRLHAALHGPLSGLGKLISRGAKPWQQALRGERPVTFTDLAELFELAASPRLESRQAREALWALIAEMQDALRPALSGDELAEAAAAFDKEAGDVGQTIIRALGDGTADDSERAAALVELNESDARSARLRAALRRPA